MGGCISLLKVSSKEPFLFRVTTLLSFVTASYLTRMLIIFKIKTSSLKSHQPPILSIPERWNCDLILQQFTCAIHHSPILTPVGDPHATKELYNHSAISQWLHLKPKSPLTSLPMHWYQIRSNRQYIIEGLIHFRLRQLKDRENEMGCELCPSGDITHKRWMDASSRELDRLIELLLKKPEEEIGNEMNEIPPFLDGNGKFWYKRDADTQKPIRHCIIPKLTGDELQANRSLASIAYEKRHIDLLFEKSPNEAPRGWPKHLLFKKENLWENLYVQSDIDHQVIVALKELRQHYKPLSKDGAAEGPFIGSTNSESSSSSSSSSDLQ